MLSQANAHATLPVKDLAGAKQFYGQTLGLTAEKEDVSGVMYQTGNSKVLVYESGMAGTNQGTACSWEVDNVEEVVEELKAKGVAFEHYDIPGAELKGDVHVMDTDRAAWFKDPAGNILCVSSVNQA